MTLVLSKAVFVQLCRIRDASRPKRAAKVSLIGQRAGKRLVIESARRTEKPVARRSLPKVVGEVFFHPDSQYLLTPSEKQHISDTLREKNELAVVVSVFSRNGDLAFYPVYFSQDIPNGVDMALEYEGSTVCQSRSPLGGSCGAPFEEAKIRTDHRQVPVYIQGRWISVDRKLARLVRLVNQIPGIASLRSCQGGMPDTGKSRHDSPAQAYLSVVPVQYTWVDFAEYRRLEALRRKPDPRLADITRRLQLKFGTETPQAAGSDTCQRCRQVLEAKADHRHVSPAMAERFCLNFLLGSERVPEDVGECRGFGSRGKGSELRAAK